MMDFLDKINEKEKEWEEKSHPLLQSEIDKLLQTIHDGQSIIESRNYEIAAGGLALSLTVLSLSYSLGKLPVGSEWAVVSIWGVFTLCILIHYISQHLSVRILSKLRDNIADLIHNRAEYNEDAIASMYRDESRILRAANKLNAVLLVIGILALTFYASYCVLI